MTKLTDGRRTPSDGNPSHGPLGQARYKRKTIRFIIFVNGFRYAVAILLTLDYDFYLTWFIEFAGKYTIGNIQVCYAAALPVSIVERS